jgi:hypothetical protein
VVRCWWHRDGGEIRSPQIGSGVTPCGGRVGLGGKLQSYYFASEKMISWASSTSLTTCGWQP